MSLIVCLYSMGGAHECGLFCVPLLWGRPMRIEHAEWNGLYIHWRVARQCMVDTSVLMGPCPIYLYTHGEVNTRGCSRVMKDGTAVHTCEENVLTC